MMCGMFVCVRAVWPLQCTGYGSTVRDGSAAPPPLLPKTGSRGRRQHLRDVAIDLGIRQAIGGGREAALRPVPLPPATATAGPQCGEDSRERRAGGLAAQGSRRDGARHVCAAQDHVHVVRDRRSQRRAAASQQLGRCRCWKAVHKEARAGGPQAAGGRARRLCWTRSPNVEGGVQLLLRRCTRILQSLDARKHVIDLVRLDMPLPSCSPPPEGQRSTSEPAGRQRGRRRRAPVARVP